MATIIFILVLFVLVLVHELGHFFAAKKTGMRVDEFGIGFPPKLWSFKRGETEYSINALPIGGFVRIYGVELADAEGAGARSAPAPSRHDDHTRSFARKPKWAQTLVLLAGIAMNVLFAWLLFSFALGHGVLTSVSPETATENAQLYILDVTPGSPAALAGIPAGAVVTAMNRGGQILSPRSPEEFRQFVEESRNESVGVHYIYQGEEKSAQVSPAKGVLDESKDSVAVGVSLGLAEVQSLPLHRAIGEGFMMTVRGLRDIAAGLVSLISSAFVFNADLAGIAGPVGIVGLVGDASALGLSSLLMFTAFISLNLAVVNLLPFPALDGGRLLFVIIEAIKGSPIKAKVAYYANATGFIILILLMLAITYNDIARLV